jgi:putative tryptophan/tyrosine transport system substrate-binding protein
MNGWVFRDPISKSLSRAEPYWCTFLTMERRAFLASMAGLLAALRAAEAQQSGKPARIGRLSPSLAETDTPLLEAFRTGMHELGWIEGQTFTIEDRFAEGNPDRLPKLAADLVRQRVDVILAGSHPGALAAKNTTTTIPIVMVTTADPVAGGLVPNFARPDGNLTGVTGLGQVLSAKRLEVLKAALPGLSRVAVLVNPASAYTAAFLKERQVIARELGLQLWVFEADGPERLKTAFSAMARGRTRGLMVLTDIMFITHRRAVIDLATSHRRPAVYGEREYVNDGGLMSYGANLEDMYRRAAFYVDKILKGARPADLPIEQPTKFELVINLKTARALGLTIPPSLLQRADQVIE